MKKMILHLSDYANSVWQPILNIKLIYKIEFVTIRVHWRKCTLIFTMLLLTKMHSVYKLHSGLIGGPTGYVIFCFLFFWGRVGGRLRPVSMVSFILSQVNRVRWGENWRSPRKKHMWPQRDSTPQWWTSHIRLSVRPHIFLGLWSWKFLRAFFPTRWFK